MVMRRMRWLGPLVAVALVVSAGPALGTGSPLRNVNWTEGVASPFAGTRFDGQYVKADNRIYFLGYRLLDGTTNGEVWYYDVAAKTYTDTGVAMPVPISNYGIAALTDPNGLGLYVFGGRDANGALIDTTQVYYPASNTAAIVASDPWPGRTASDCVSLPAMGVAAVGNKAYVLGGFSLVANGCQDELSAQTWKFNPMAAAGSRWKQGPDLNVARGYITPAVIGTTIYAIGGDTISGGAPVPNSSTESWTVGSPGWDDAGVADLPEVCDETQAFGFSRGPLKNTVTVAGCGQWPNAVADVLQYDKLSNSWSVIGALNEARRNQAGAVYGGAKKPKLFILGGYDATGGVVLSSSEIGKPAPLAGPLPPSHPSAGTASLGPTAS
jgi:hypothetical protein